MRIAVVAACPFPWPRGTPIRIHRMAEALAARGHDVHVVTYHLGKDEPTPLLTVHRIDGPRWYRRTTPGPSWTKLALLDPLLTLCLRRVLQRQHFDVVHAHHYEGLLAALLAGGAPPVVFDSHTLLESELPTYGEGLVSTLARRAGLWLDRRLPRRAAQVIAVSDEIRDRLQSAGDMEGSRIAVIPNGVETEHFRSAGSVGEAPEVLAFAGNLAPYQRIDLLLRAFAIVRATRPSARLKMLTNGDFGAYADLLHELDIANHVDVIEADYASLPVHLGHATVLANPRTECSGIPQKLLNYMASGTATVSFASSAKLLANERSGLVVADSDVQGFAAAVLRLMDEPALRARLGTCAQQTVARDHSWDEVAARVEQVYAKAVTG